MSSLSKGAAFPNVPAPTGTRPASAHMRFIPREELGDFAAWKPGSINGGLGDRRGAQRRAEPDGAPTSEAASAHVEKLRRAALQEGYQNGYRDGLVALDAFKQSFAQQTTAQVGALINGMEDAVDALQPTMAQAVSRVAIELAAQVLRSELATRPELVCAVATQALTSVLLSARHIAMQLHPQDVALVELGAAEVLKSRGVRLIGNARLSRGDCIIDSDVGVIDARIATRWAQATASLAVDLPAVLEVDMADGGDNIDIELARGTP